MSIYTMTLKEMFRRPGHSLTAFMIVAVGVTALIAVESIVTSSEKKVASQMQQLGANILVLPEGVKRDARLSGFPFAFPSPDGSGIREHQNRISRRQDNPHPPAPRKRRW